MLVNKVKCTCNVAPVSGTMYSALAARPGGYSHGCAPPTGKALHKPAKNLPRRAFAKSGAKRQPADKLKADSSASLAEALASEPLAKKIKLGAKAAIGANLKAAIGAKGFCKPLLTGSVFEGDWEHLKRHKAEGQAGKCLRCIYLSNPGNLAHIAKLPRAAGGFATWLEPRPCHMGGSWALGCRVCAWYNITQAANRQPLAASPSVPRRKHKKKDIKNVADRARAQVRFSTFANFSFSRVQLKDIKKGIEQHNNSQAHEVACKAFAHKESANCELRVLPEAGRQLAGKAQEVFKGRVPKPKDWLDSFVETTSNISWRKQGKLKVQKSGRPSGEPLAPKPHVAQAPGASPGPPAQRESGQPLAASQAAPRETMENLRKRRRKQTKIMAELVRRKHCRILRKAKFCTLALDEAQSRKLIHFRCDYHEAPWFYQGTMGIFKSTPKTSEEGAGDHAQRVLMRLDEFLTKFCTPLRKKSLGAQCDNELKEHILKIVTTLSADGGSAERRALFLACEMGFHFDWVPPGLLGWQAFLF